MTENLISFKTDSGHTIFLEATELENSGNGMQPVSRNDNKIITRATTTLSEALEPVKSVAQSILKAFSGFDHAPNEFQIELSVKISAEAGIIITKGSLEGNFKISLKWTK